MKKDNEEKNTDDIVYEAEEGTSFKAPSIEKLKKKLLACEQEKKEYLEGWQKARADLINLRKQDEAEKQNIRRYASEEVLLELVSVLDSFEMAFKNKDAWEAISKEWRTGVEYIYTQLKNILSSRGITEINPIGEEFDPQKHEAVEMVAGKDNIVLEIVQKGYLLNEKIIRTAKVKIGNGN